ncbi:MAG TPA: glycosyltransferase family 2 protein, partial [Flavisolibacter sp.]|nr:glycosyltransferase family 2 protein [Flavisolibacter sp.]
SRIFGHYHLGHYNKDENHEVSVLAGAFMMVKKTVLDSTGCFDELFFMYGEDVDLSYRIQKAGYKNYYVADTTIIHFKGESTKRGSLNYVRMFYQAMSHFVQKHYGGTRASVFNATVQFAIWIRALLAATGKLIKWIGLPIIDGFLILLSFFLVKEFWIHYIRPDITYPQKILNYSFPIFTVIYLFIAYYAGLYDRYYKSKVLIQSTFIATLVLIALYSLLPENLRFSRGIVLFGALLAIVFITSVRVLMVNLNLLIVPVNRFSRPHLLIAGNKEEFSEVNNFLRQRKLDSQVIGRISIGENKTDAITDLEHLNEIAFPLDAKEIIFCAGSLSYQRIIQQVQLTSGNLKLRFHAINSKSIIGSDINSSKGEILSGESDYNLSLPVNKRNKVMTDILIAFVGILGFPLHAFFIKSPMQFLKNCFSVIGRRKTWIGYFRYNSQLPQLPKGILGPNGQPLSASPQLPESSIQMIDYCYARDYQWAKDGKILLISYKYLGS